MITLNHGVGSAPNIRPAGTDFTKGTPLSAPRRLSAGDVALLAAMNVAQVPVTRAPVVALISTGDELVMPGEVPGDDQIIVSNTFGLAAMLADVAAEMGMQQSFYKVAMRPGKPLMAGMLAGVPMIGLPGNPVSAMVCGTVFLAPVIRALQGLGRAPAPCRQMPLTTPLEANGPREHYMRAVACRGTWWM